jgi:hypothetical protein
MKSKVRCLELWHREGGYSKCVFRAIVIADYAPS